MEQAKRQAQPRHLALIGDSGNGRDHQHPPLDAVIGVSGGEASRPMRGRRVDAGSATHRRDQSACHVSHRPTGFPIRVSNRPEAIG